MEVIDRLRAVVGEEVGVTDWMEITQDRVDGFAAATDDHQWIHVDRERAAMSSFGGTIAHGFLTLSLTVALTDEVPLDVGSPLMGINYGLEKVRFPAPVPVGSRIRWHSAQPPGHHRGRGEREAGHGRRDGEPSLLLNDQLRLLPPPTTITSPVM
jgi:acyl dehydratase